MRGESGCAGRLGFLVELDGLGAVEGFGGREVLVHGFLFHDAVGGDLAEHVERIEPGTDGLELDFFVNSGDGYALNVDGAAVGGSGDFLAFAGGGLVW